jgi:DNA-directed RNA polymerase I subunit RPA1
MLTLYVFFSSHGDYDTLDSPSSRIVVGRVVEGGTGSFDVLQPLTSEA